MKKLNVLTRMLLLVALLVGSVSNVWGTLPETPRWVATNLSDISDNATVIIISNSTIAKDITLPSTTTSSNPEKVACTISTTAGISTITAPNGKTLQDLAWTLKKVDGGYKFYQEGSSTVRLYLTGTSSNTALRVGDASSSNDKFVLGDLGKLLKVTTATRFVGPYDNGGSDWRTYNTENATNYKGAALTFYVLETSTDPAINAEDVVIDSEDTSGEISYTISNPNSSSFNATEKSPGYDWIDNVTKDEVNKKVTFTTTVNTGAAREGYITLTYGTLTKDVKVTQSAYVEKYNITINSMTNGTVTSNKAKAAEDETVTLTITPVTGYELSTITVTDADEGNVAVSGTGNTRTFTMPAKAVTVSATFVLEKGGWLNPYTVDEIIGSSISGNKYVRGYIVGDLTNKAYSVNTKGTFADSNLALATTPSANDNTFDDRDDVIAIQLSDKNIIKVNNKMSTHSYLIGKEAIVYGSVEDYFGRKGVKSPKLIFVDNVMTLKDFGEESKSDIPGYSEDGNILYYTNSSVTGKNIIKEESDGTCSTTSTVKITEGESFRVLSDVSVPSIENSRVISATSSNTDAYTWYEPYNYTLAAEKGTAYSFTGVSGTTLQFTAIGSTTLTANTPYLIVPTADVDASVTSTVTLKATPNADVTGGTQSDWTFKGTFTGMTAAEAAAINVYGLNAGNKWLYFTGSEGFGMPPFRAYMVNASGHAKIMESILDTDTKEEQEVTAIELINNNGSENRIYTLDGKYVGTKSEVLSKGMYIVNGKKFVVK